MDTIGMVSYVGSVELLMGLFDNLFGGKSNKEFTNTEAYAGILLGASACDGHIADEEVDNLFGNIAKMHMFQSMTSAQVKALFDRLLKVLRKDGPEGLIDRCIPQLPEDFRNTVFANAADLILTDGIVEDEEKAFLDRLQKKLEIDGDTALTIVEVMVIKNKA